MKHTINEIIVNLIKRRRGLFQTLLFLFVLLCSVANSAQAQKFIPYTWQDYIDNLTQDEEQAENYNWSEWVDEITQLHDHPLDLNHAEPQELEKIPTLTPEAVEQIQAYIYLNGPFQTLAELRLVPGLTEEMLRVAPLFLYINPKTAIRAPYTPKKEAMHGHLDYRTDIPCYYRKGYCVQPGYAGDPLYHRMRGEVKWKKIALGLRMEKDAGEHYFDSYGGYISMDGKKWLRRIVIGDYRAGFGQGLVLGSGSNWGLSSLQNNVSQGIRPMKGMDEFRFLRGISAELQFSTPRCGNFIFTPIWSWRKMDATLNDDGQIRTLQHSGLHRTMQERQAQHSINFLLLGGHVAWLYKHLELGATATWLRSSREFSPGTTLYRFIYPQGMHFGNLATNYSFRAYRWQVAGEVAYSLERGGWATVHRLNWRPTPRWQLALLPRFYSYRHYAFFASAPSTAGSGAQNESGITLHLNYRPITSLRLNLLADMAHHPWPRYGTTQSANRYRVQAEGELSLSNHHLLGARYQWQYGLERGNVWRTHHRTRVQWTWQPTTLHRIGATLQTHLAAKRTGWSISMRWGAQSPKERWSGMLVGSYFHIPNYLQRLWAYEPSLLGSLTGSTLHGHGIRLVGKLRWISKNDKWRLEAKGATTYRIDTAVQSSGLQTILGHWKTDLSALAQFRF